MGRADLYSLPVMKIGMVIIKRFLVLALLLFLICFAGCNNSDNAQDNETVGISLTETTVNIDANTSSFFADTNPIYIGFTERAHIEETGDLEILNSELCMSDQDKIILMELISPYNSALSPNIIKSDFMSYYSITLDNSIELIIDANCSNHGGDKSYMFVRRINNGLLSVYGTYIDANIVVFLSEKIEE